MLVKRQVVLYVVDKDHSFQLTYSTVTSNSRNILSGGSILRKCGEGGFCRGMRSLFRMGMPLEGRLDHSIEIVKLSTYLYRT